MKLLHLYHDLMNLYGDYANVAALQRILEASGETVTVDRRSVGEEAVLADYDFIYIGSGTERNQRVALKDLRGRADALRECIDSGKVVLMTGNAFEMLGKSITDAQGRKFRGLGFFGFTVTEQNKTRLTSDAVFTCSFLNKPLVGFINKCSEIHGVKTPPFQVRMGLGNEEGDLCEGVRRKNCFGTHLTGPVLIKNPHFLAYLAQKLLGKAPDTARLTHERAGYEVTLRELQKRAETE